MWGGFCLSGVCETRVATSVFVSSGEGIVGVSGLVFRVRDREIGRGSSVYG